MYKRRFVIDLVISSILLHIIYGIVFKIFTDNPLYSIAPSVSAVITGSISIVFGVTYLSLRYQIGLSSFLEIKENNKRVFTWGVLGGLGISILGMILLVFIWPEKKVRYYQEPFSISFCTTIFVFLMYIIVVPIIEEIYFRGIIFRTAIPLLGRNLAYVVASGLFALGHGFNVFSIFLSIVLCFIYEKTNVVWSSIIAHSIYNCIWFATVFVVEYYN